MNLEKFLSKLKAHAHEITFNDAIAVIDECYNFTPAAFTNGGVVNEANQNNGSCKIFAFGLLNNLSEQQALACFGSYYRDDVLGNPDGNDHQNIRNFISTGWNGIKFDGEALT